MILPLASYLRGMLIASLPPPPLPEPVRAPALEPAAPSAAGTHLAAEAERRAHVGKFYYRPPGGES